MWVWCLLNALRCLTGTSGPSGRVVVDLDDESGRLADVTAAIAGQGVTRVILRVGTANPSAVGKALRAQPFDVVSPLRHGR